MHPPDEGDRAWPRANYDGGGNFAGEKPMAFGVGHGLQCFRRQRARGVYICVSVDEEYLKLI